MDFFQHRRQEEIDQASDNKCHFCQGEKNSCNAPVEMQFFQIEFNQRLKYVGNQAGQEKWQKHVAQSIDKPVYACYEREAYQNADNSVKCEWAGL